MTRDTHIDISSFRALICRRLVEVFIDGTITWSLGRCLEIGCGEVIGLVEFLDFNGFCLRGRGEGGLRAGHG